MRYLMRALLLLPSVAAAQTPGLPTPEVRRGRDCLFQVDGKTYSIQFEMRLPKMTLGAGSYSVAVEIAAEGYIEKGITKFFSVDPEVYHCITHALDFTVTNSGWIGDGTIFEGEGDWTIKAAAKESA